MIQKSAVLVGVICGITGLLGGTSIAQADTVLNRAQIQELRNQVEFIPEDGAARMAELSDQMIPGDALSTDQDSFAELRFNDGSLARLGELALFRFQPNTRTLNLDNGTMLWLIPPGQGTSRLRTPNATAGIRGSGLFIRYIDGQGSTDATTIIGALTTSGIEVANAKHIDPNHDGGDGSLLGAEAVELNAGYMAVIVGDRPPQLFTFDLDVFYQTSALVEGLALSGEPSIWSEEIQDGTHSLSIGQPDTSTPSASDSGTELEENAGNVGNDAGNDAINGRDPLALVREETRDGLLAQEGTLTTPFIDNPPFIYGAWQSNTVWQPLSQPAGQATSAIDGANPTDVLDALAETADILMADPSDSALPPIDVDPGIVLDPPQPFEDSAIDPFLVGPDPEPFSPVDLIEPTIEPAVVEPPTSLPIAPPDVIEPPVPLPIDPPEVVNPPTPIPVDPPEVINPPNPIPVDPPEVVNPPNPMPVEPPEVVNPPNPMPVEPPETVEPSDPMPSDPMPSDPMPSEPMPSEPMPSEPMIEEPPEEVMPGEPFGMPDGNTSGPVDDNNSPMPPDDNGGDLITEPDFEVPGG